MVNEVFDILIFGDDTQFDTGIKVIISEIIFITRIKDIISYISRVKQSLSYTTRIKDVEDHTI